MKKVFKGIAVFAVIVGFASLSGMGHRTNFTANWLYGKAVGEIAHVAGHTPISASQRGE